MRRQIVGAAFTGVFWAGMACVAAAVLTVPFLNIFSDAWFSFVLSSKWTFFNPAELGFRNAQTSQCFFTLAVTYVRQIF